MKKQQRILPRRRFLKDASLVAGGLATMPFFAPSMLSSKIFADGTDAIKVALVGCGGRGTGAALQALSVKQNTRLVAVCDAFRDNLDACLKEISTTKLPDGKAASTRIDVSEDRKFTGFEGYKKAIAEADVVILTTPPGFRPIHFEEAIRQGKHVFMEKPCAVDPAGVQKVLAAAELAKSKKLNVVVGLQRHYQTIYRELMKRVHDGKIGQIVSAQAWWNNDGVWVRPRTSSQTEMEYQMRNWYYFNWLCGDHITEQHIHNLDVINWAKGAYPVRAQGIGGRTVRVGKDFGEIFDHHCVQFEYADGMILDSECRHHPGTAARVDERLVGTKGTVVFGQGLMRGHNGKTILKHDDKNDANPYQTEHDELFAAIEKGQFKFSDAENGAKATMTSILGRMATYSGQPVEWDAAINSGLAIGPKKYDWQAAPPVLPAADGLFACSVPGVSKAF